MEHSFDKEYWESHWHDRAAHGIGREMTVNEHLVREVRNLAPGTAIDAGCGEGAEAIWLAAAGWQVTAVDISSEALHRASLQATTRHVEPLDVRWVEADLSAWEPPGRFDLVATHYAHPATPQLDFYERISRWVAPGGTLLIVGHLHTAGDHHTENHADHHTGHRTDHHTGDGAAAHTRDNRPPDEASVTAAQVTAVLEPTGWDIVVADELTRIVAGRAGESVRLDDVVVRAVRRR